MKSQKKFYAGFLLLTAFLLLSCDSSDKKDPGETDEPEETTSKTFSWIRTESVIGINTGNYTFLSDGTSVYIAVSDSDNSEKISVYKSTDGKTFSVVGTAAFTSQSAKASFKGSLSLASAGGKLSLGFIDSGDNVCVYTFDGSGWSQTGSSVATGAQLSYVQVLYRSDLLYVSYENEYKGPYMSYNNNGTWTSCFDGNATLGTYEGHVLVNNDNFILTSQDNDGDGLYKLTGTPSAGLSSSLIESPRTANLGHCPFSYVSGTKLYFIYSDDSNENRLAVKTIDVVAGGSMQFISSSAAKYSEKVGTAFDFATRPYDAAVHNDQFVIVYIKNAAYSGSAVIAGIPTVLQCDGSAFSEYAIEGVDLSNVSASYPRIVNGTGDIRTIFAYYNTATKKIDVVGYIAK